MNGFTYFSGSQKVCFISFAYVGHVVFFHHVTVLIGFMLRHYSTNRKVAGSIPDEVNF
jgi:hypothetical protein